MMPTMTRKQFDTMGLEELVEWAYENIDDVHYEDDLINMAKHEIDKENLNVAIHILTGIYESEEAVNGCYLYDRCMGTLEAVTPITCKEDLEDYIDFEEDTSVSFNHVDEIWEALEACKTATQIDKILDNIPSKFGAWWAEVIAAGELEISNQWWDRNQEDMIIESRTFNVAILEDYER